MGLVYLLLLIPLAVLWALKITLIRQSAVSVIRMTVQLVLVGLYLRFIFELNSIWVNGLWMLIMIVSANLTVLRGAGLPFKRYFAPTFTGIALSTFLIAGFLVFLAVRPAPFYDARYLIPITGMILGNCLRSNVIALERFYSAIRTNEREYLTYLLMGATPFEAALPFFRKAVRAALAPTVSTMATLGIVSLPGMMTGQILGGSFPMTAIKYQIAIMIAIFSSTALATALNILLTMKVSFDEYGIVR